jgi:D-alanyl-D-alanine-carboxypeptidase/D-alanyl-D-alanine-endopeptidase
MSILFKKIIAVLVLFSGVSAGLSTAVAADEYQQLLQLLQNQLEEKHQGIGISGAIIDQGKVTYVNLGLASKLPARNTASDQLFEIGSVSKTFTSIALASMVSEGKVELTDPVQKYLPNTVTLPIKNGKPITLLSLANHSSGLPRLPTNMAPLDLLDPYADYTVAMMYDFLNEYKLPTEVGQVHDYSNLAVGLLGHTLALIDKVSYQQMITTRVLKPLQMVNTYVDVPFNHLAKLTDGHDIQLNKTKHWQLPTLAGAGAIKSTTQDMVRFLQANINRKPLAAPLSLSQQDTADFNLHGNRIGLGWFNQKHANGRYIWHNGGTGGYRSFIGFDRQKAKGIVLMANSIYPLDKIAKAYLTDNLATLLASSQCQSSC